MSPREYYYEGKDLILLTVAEETRDESVVISKIDEKVPELTANNYNGKYGTDKEIRSLFTKEDFGKMGGSSCDDVTLGGWNQSVPLLECVKKSWLYQDWASVWTITPMSNQSD